jgi:hypothetical protein
VQDLKNHWQSSQLALCQDVKVCLFCLWRSMQGLHTVGYITSTPAWHGCQQAMHTYAWCEKHTCQAPSSSRKSPIRQ